MAMENDQRLSGSLQENVLTVLCFDDARCKQIRAALTHKTFENAVYREVAGAAIDFIDAYGEAIKEHLPDHLEHVLKGDSESKAKAYERLLGNLYAAREHVNGEYVMTELHKFVRLQRFKSALIDAVDAIENNGDIDKAETIMSEGMKSQSVSFERGTALDSPEDVAAIFDEPEEEGFDLNIEEFDRNGIIPRRKELTLFIAPRGKGKSWFITHCAKQALLQRWSVAVITLEMSEKRYAARFLQSFFSISKRESQVRVARLSKDRNGDLTDIIHEQIERMVMTNPDTRNELLSRATREFRKRPPLRIKQFPTGDMTLSMLEAWLDGLERFENFVPDVICLDYPDLAKLDSKNLRVELGQIVSGFRGICVKRNAAAIAVSQGNRESEKATTVTGDMAAEDISKLATADVCFTYSQTPAEYELGLARLLAEKARNERAKQMVLVTQAYDIGQFALDSVRVRAEDYFNLLDDKAERRAGGGRRRTDREEPEEEDEAPRRRGGRRRTD